MAQAQWMPTLRLRNRRMRNLILRRWPQVVAAATCVGMEPAGFLVQEPDVSSPQEHVQEPDNHGDIASWTF